MKEQLINEICLTFGRVLPDVNPNTIRSVLTVALEHYTVTKNTTELTVYELDPNEKLLMAFLVSKKVNGATDKTINRYAFIIRQFFRKVEKNADQCNANDIRIYFAKREIDDKVSAVTRNGERSVLCSFFQWLNDEEIITRNPMRKIPKIKAKKEQKKAFDDMELEKIRNGCKSEKETAIIEILISTGCRVSELCGIKLEEIDGDTVIVHGKGNKDRTCYLTAKARLAIDEYIHTDYFQKRYKLGSPYLFARENLGSGEYMNQMGTASVENLTKRIGRDVGIDKCHPHRFRRTCATMALNRGMPIEQVSKMLGHESVETTQIYLDLNEETLKNACKKYVC